MKKNLSVMLLDDDPVRASMVEQVLLDNGCLVIYGTKKSIDLLGEIEKHQPDVIVVDTDSPDRDILENVHMVTRNQPRPIVLFTSESDETSMNNAIKAGVSAYVVDGLQESRIKAVIDVAITRFEEYQSLKQELDVTKSKLADRKDIDIAKGLLNKYHKMNEEQAYKALRKIAMDRKITIGEAARNLISITNAIE
ncbi:MAG: ANTAR domain-containing protein [Pseudomonadota bacterium]